MHDDGASIGITAGMGPQAGAEATPASTADVNAVPLVIASPSDARMPMSASTASTVLRTSELRDVGVAILKFFAPIELGVECPVTLLS